MAAESEVLLAGDEAGEHRDGLDQNVIGDLGRGRREQLSRDHRPRRIAVAPIGVDAREAGRRARFDARADGDSRRGEDHRDVHDVIAERGRICGRMHGVAGDEHLNGAAWARRALGYERRERREPVAHQAHEFFVDPRPARDLD
ncbi:MAG: hypothetical protein ABT08_05430 [Microbacterium sp. SCN 71-21]|nr:MAG: hypothetical protein ABT08_05430 [Microbacterium sp. SCN 71-21]